MSCANSWRRIEALGWFDFGYPHWIVYLLAGAFGSFGSYMYIQAEFELRKHNHGATGLGAFRSWLHWQRKQRALAQLALPALHNRCAALS